MRRDAFGFVEPIGNQVEKIERCSNAAFAYAEAIESSFPAGGQKAELIGRVLELDALVTSAVLRDPNGNPKVK